MTAARIINPNYTIDLEQISCCNCGTLFAAPAELLNDRRKSGGNFFCPAGHPMIFKNTEISRLKQRLDDALARENEERARANRERDNAEAARKLAALNDRKAKNLASEVTRQKKRASAGVCSCCNRTFANLARHMAAKHKEVA